jgi:myo-inositol-1-phosphate synthase
VTRKIGVWIAGAYGNVGTCAVAGAAAVARGLLPAVGLVTETRELRDLDLVPLEDLVFGGHDVREGSLRQTAQEFGERNGLLTPALRLAVADDLDRADEDIRPGVLLNPTDEVRRMSSEGFVATGSPREMIARVQADLRAFRDRHELDSVIVVNLISTEPDVAGTPALESLDAFRAAIVADETDGIPSSVLYAYAALDAGFPFVDFTPAIACSVAPVREIALLRGVPFMGRDGKTGETLVKTVLAPMFLARHFRVLSWEGANLLGNRDGAVLQGSGALASKVRDKDEALRRILGDDDMHTGVRIDYVPSLDDWKQAYDFIHFEGFLGARMQMHFLWQGCDSALAAPLVLDLVRLTDLARRRGEVGTLPHLACFFKSPVDVEQQGFADQMDLLHRYAETVRAERAACAAESSARRRRPTPAPRA